MHWWERSILVASGIAVRVRGADPDWLEFVPPEVEADSVAATLCLEFGGSSGDRRAGPIAFEAELRWDAPDRARFRVPGGRGELVLGGQQVDVRLSLEARSELAAIGTTLRMLLGLLLPAHGGLLVHASAVTLDERAHVFLGASGAGKTTTANRLAGEGARLIAEDLLVLRAKPGRMQAELCRFDYCAPASDAVGRQWPVAGAYLVYKGAETTQVCAARTAALQAWSSAIFSPLVSPAWTAQFMSALSATQRIPLHGLAAAPGGPLRPALDPLLGEPNEQA